MQVTAPPMRFGLIVALTIALTACALPGSGVRDPDRQAGRASEMESQGDYAGAADLYARIASVSSGIERDRFLIAAARNWYESGEDHRAAEALQRVEGPLRDNDLSLWALLSASLALLEREPESALTFLSKVPPRMSRDYESWSALLSGQAYFQLGQVAEGVTMLANRERWLDGTKAREANGRDIWNGLQQVSASDIQNDLNKHLGPVVAGWLELALAARLADRNPFEFKAGLAGWRQRFPGHPADGPVLLQIVEAYRVSTDYPQQVALLLPLGGREKTAAEAIREGFMAAYFQQADSDRRPDVRVYDVSALGAAEAYRQALLEGADFVVGPLTRRSVAEVAVSDNPRIRMLALNYLDDEAEVPAGFFQFALAPEDEAREVARRIIAEGHSRGVALIPNSDWGMRIRNAFEQELRAQGGQLVDYRAYDPSAQDHSTTITRLLLLSDSRSRQSQLSSTLGRSLQFSPRRRQDTEFIFLAARPAQGTQIRPQLRFHSAANIPVYSTSSIYEPGLADNSLLSGVEFTDMPWMVDPDIIEGQLHRSVTKIWPMPNARGRLFAMGFDAFRLVPLLHAGSIAQRPVSGMTGTLWVDPQLRIRRNMDWAAFNQGLIKKLPGIDPFAIDRNRFGDGSDESATTIHARPGGQ